MNSEQQTTLLSEKRHFAPRKYLARLQEKIASSPYSYLFYCFIVPVVIMYLIYMAMEIHPFGDGTVLVLDLNGQYVYFFEALRNTVYGEGSMLYTFFRGLGGEFMGMYAYYLASPLSYIVALFPQSRIQEALLTIILLKVGLCGLSFGFYLHKNSKNHNKIVSVAFAVMYSLCAYAVVYQNNMMWIDALIWLPIITYGVEQLIKNRRYKLFVISLSLGIMSNFYIGYMLCIYVMLYYFYYCFAHSKEELNPHNEKLHMPRSFVRIACFSLLAVSISAFIILAAYYSLTFGKTTFSDPNWSFKTKFDILNLLTKFLPGSYDTVRPQGLPFVYCGVLTLILLPVYFMTKKIPSREKIVSLIFICVFLLCFIASPLDLIWHGFQSPNWLNYRYSFMLSFFLLVLAYKGFGNLRSVSEKFILGISAFIILFVTVCNKLEFETYVETNGKLLELETVWLTVIVTVALLSVLCLLIRQKNPIKRESISGVLAIIVCIEIFCSSLACVVQFDGDVAYSSYSRYNDFIGGLRPIVSAIEEKDDGFYRAEKLVHKKYNDNMALGLRGVSNSTSTLNSETISFLNRMGYASASHHSQYYGGNPVNDSLLGIKYLIDQKNSQKLVDVYEEFATVGDYTAYYNQYALSIAYGVDSAVTEFKMERYSSTFERYFERMNNMVSTMLGDDYSSDIFVSVDQSTVDTEKSPHCTQTTSSSMTTYSPTVEGADNSVSYTFTAPAAAEYYFYVPCKRSAEVELYVNDTYIGKYLGSNSKYIASLGYFEAGAEVSVKLSLLEDDLTVYTYYDMIWYIDNAAFEDAFTKLLANPQFNITEYTEDNLIGNITTSVAEQTVQTTIPYDEGWKVYVDGEEVEIFKTFDALMAFNIENTGTHTLEFEYKPDVYTFGAVISIFGTLIFALICILDLIFYFAVIKKKRPDAYVRKDTMWGLEDFDQDSEEMLLTPKPEKIPFKKRIADVKAKFTKNKLPSSEDASKDGTDDTKEGDN
ncbi:MAG: YfhO family protein [Clostridia bacterium]|nr:YfhO family protein [Clostridia bacterium]